MLKRSCPRSSTVSGHRKRELVGDCPFDLAGVEQLVVVAGDRARTVPSTAGGAEPVREGSVASYASTRGARACPAGRPAPAGQERQREGAGIAAATSRRGRRTVLSRNVGHPSGSRPRGTSASPSRRTSDPPSRRTERTGPPTRCENVGALNTGWYGCGSPFSESSRRPP